MQWPSVRSRSARDRAAWEASPRGGHVFRGYRAVLGGDPTRVPCRSFFETTPDRRSSVPPSPSAREIRWQKLAAAQGFPSGYRFAGNQGDKVKQIGNVVPLDVAKALVLPGWEPPESAQNR